MIKVKELDAAEFLRSEEDMTMYLNAMIEENGLRGLQRGLGVVARAKGMTEMAGQAGVGRQNLYKALSSDANPKIETISKVVDALGMKIAIAPAR